MELRPAFLLLLTAAAARCQAPTAESIMARVAANQDAAEAQRALYVYVQHGHVSSRRGHRDMCEETTDFRITPSASGSERQLLSLDGRVWRKGAYVQYHELKRDREAEPENGVSVKISDADDEMDRDLVENLRKNLTDEKSKDGFHAGLFPLSSKGQQQYLFTLAGRERMNGRDVFHITFRPKDNSDFDWKGDAYIDAAAYQPVLLRTRLSRNVPFLVRTMLGTSVPGLGFSATYEPQPDGVWFPASFGTEFHINVLFFLRRTITMSFKNRDFQKTHTDSRILGEARVVEAPNTEPAPAPHP